MGAMSAEAVEARKAYQREYRIRNRDKINSRRKNWRAENRDRVRQYNREYWEGRKGIRASWEDYGITPERLHELTGIVRSEKYDSMVLSAARKADESAAGHIIMSVKENVSYETLEARQAAGKIERIALGRSDFYGVRRLFFHYIDIALSEIQAGKSEEVNNG